MLLHSAAICDVAFRHWARVPRSMGPDAASVAGAALLFPRPFLPIAPPIHLLRALRRRSSYSFLLLAWVREGRTAVRNNRAPPLSYLTGPETIADNCKYASSGVWRPRDDTPIQRAQDCYCPASSPFLPDSTLAFTYHQQFV
jgi:hypothetical protein